MGYSTSGEFTNAERTKLANIEALADVTNNANAVMDADFSGAKGFMEKASAGVYDLITSQELNADVLDLIRQMHPNVSVLVAIDDDYNINIGQIAGSYVLGITNRETFDLLTNGGLNGQDDWVCSANFTVQDTVYHGASGKAIIHGAGNEVFTHAITAHTSGTVSMYVRTTSTANQFGNLELKEGATLKLGVGMTGTHFQYLNNAGAYVNLPTDTTYVADTWYKIEYTYDAASNEYTSIKIDGVEKAVGGIASQAFTEIDNVDVRSYENGVHSYYDVITFSDFILPINKTIGNGLTCAIAANAAVLSFFSHLKGKFSNGASSHAIPVGVEIFGNGDSYAAALNGTTKFKIDPTDPRIELYRIDDSVVAKSGTQANWTMDDDGSTGAFAAKTTSTHETILGEEIGCASVVMVEKSVNGAFTDTEVLIENDDYTVDYSTRTATKIILTSAEAADIVISQSKLRITWIADVEYIEGTANTALKMKIYLSRTNTGEASPEIQKIDLGTDKYAEMQYLCG